MNVATGVQSLLRLWLRHSSAQAFDDATWRPEATQREKLLEIVRRNAGTAFGREHGFRSIRSVADFQGRVPPSSYDGVSPYVERMIHGEPDVLTAERPLLFATTSGTTGRAKYIPVTRSFLREYSHAIHVHSYRMLCDVPDALEGRILVSSSSDEEGRTPCGIPYGAISGYLARTQPAALRRFYALPYAICRVKDVELKYYLTLRHALASDIRVIVTPNPSSLLLLAQRMEEFAERLIRDVRDGGVRGMRLPEDVPGAVLDGLAPDPARADRLAACRRERGALLPRDAWPQLRMISCWKGGTMPLYLRALPPYYGDVPVRDLGYMASEGRGATPLVNSGAAGVAAITSHFFEYVRDAERDHTNPEYLTCDRLETDGEYWVHLTTSGGLYRYDINDLVRVVDWYRETPVLQFVRKGQGISSITGEKLTESQVTAALLEVVERNGFDLTHATARVEWGNPPRYAVFCECTEPWSPERGRQFLAEIDRALARHNCEYEGKRSSRRLGAPELRLVSPGSYTALRQRRVAEGAPEAQVKIPHLSCDLAFGTEFQVVAEHRLEAGVA
jgi:hypothetical protein